MRIGTYNLNVMRTITRTSILIIALLCLIQADAQKEKYWLDNSLELCKKKDASHYMLITACSKEYHLEMFDIEGRLKMIGTSNDSRGEVFEGYFEFYHDNGMVESKGHYLEDYKVGVWDRFDMQGNRLAERMYAAYNPGKNAFFYVDEMPMYEGGNENFLNFLKQKLEPLVNDNEIAQNEATVELGFVVSENGFLEGVELVKGLDAEWNDRALNELQAMPHWLPGKKSGENVRVWMQLAVNLSR